MKAVAAISACWFALFAHAAPYPAAPTFLDLMDPALYPNPQRGLTVEQALSDGDVIRVQTTGAEIAVDCARGAVTFHQRIGQERVVAELLLGTPLEGARLSHSGPGLARIEVERPALAIRINGDSLFMLHVQAPLEVKVRRQIAPAWSASFKNNHVVVDERGGFGLYCSDATLSDGFEPLNETVAVYPLPADAVLWLGVCPPKPYDWDRSLKDNVVWHWSNEVGYPADSDLKLWREHGNIVLLQSEVLLWKDWNLDFVPRLGEAEFARVRNTLHNQGQRFIVYTSPYYFLKGTALEGHALNSFEDFKGWPPGTPTGENMELFLPAIRRVMSDYKPDGLYFDGQYTDNPAALYALARSAREIVGDDGILEWHSTWALGPDHCSLPQADAYVDFLLRGEGRGGLYSDFNYLRFFVSGYNISNCIGVLCNNGPEDVTAELVNDVLRANARLHTIVSWMDRPETMRVLREEYQARLTSALREEVEKGIDARQAAVAANVEAALAEIAALEAPPNWTEPARSVDFDALPEGEPVVSAVNTNAFAVRDGALEVTGHAHTHAFLRIPLNLTSRGFVVKLRQGGDGGMSWGPAAMLQWPGGAGLRIGTRSDGTIQADISGVQLHGDVYDPSEWIWLRARWGENRGIVEKSADGEHFERVWTFEHGGAFNEETVNLLVGKVPYDGQPHDHSEPGASGTCSIEFVRVFP